MALVLLLSPLCCGWLEIDDDRPSCHHDHIFHWGNHLTILIKLLLSYPVGKNSICSRIVTTVD